MNLAVIGFGNAGGKIADRLLAFERESGRSLSAFALAVNAAAIDLEKLEEIPERNRLLVGQTHEQVKGRGAGADPELGAEVTRQNINEIERALDGVPLHAVDGFLVVAGLGGGTGSGGAPVLTDRLRETYEEPVFGLGVMPGSAEGGRASLNAARSLQSFTNATDNLMLFDNDAWRQTDDSIEGGYKRTNEELARRFVTLLAAGEIDGSQVSETAMDSSDIRRTLSTGGVSTIAYSEATVEKETRKQQGLLGSLSTNGHDKGSENADLPMKIHGLVRKAVQSRLTCPADVSSAERALIVISGPPREFSQKGLQRARQWLEQETQTVEVLAGDDPRRDSDTLSACVLLSNVTDVPRVDRLQEQAVGAQDSIDDQAATREDEIDELITDEQNRIDPV
jgi:cell division GTPase FtsZ